MLRKSLPLKSRLELYRVIATYAKEKKSITKLLENKAIRARANGKLPNGKIFIAINNNIINENMRVSDAFKEFIPNDEYLYFSLGERRGNLHGTLTELVYMVEKKSELNKRFMSVALKPSLFFVVAFIMVGVVVYKVVPEMMGMLEPGDLDPTQEFIINVLTPFLSAYYPIISGISLMLLAYMIWRMPHTQHHGFRKVLDRYSPAHVLYKDFVSSIILLGVGCSMKGGTTLDDYFGFYRDSATAYGASWAQEIYTNLTSGDFAVAQSLDVGIFDIKDMEQIYDYAEGSGSIEESLSVIGREAVDTAIERIEKKANQIFWSLIALFFISMASYLGTIVGAGSSSMDGNFF